MPRSRKPGLAEVAARAGVSLATVSRALSQPKMLQAETLKRVHEAARELGYRPNRKASALASGRSRTVGVAVPTLNSAIFAEALQEIQRTLYEEGYQLLVASHEYDPLAESVAIGELVSHGVDGLVVVGGKRPATSWELLRAAEVPLVQVWEGVPEHDRVIVDNHEAGRLIARFLIDTGHRSFGVICAHLQNNDRQQARVDGIRTALEAHGLELSRTQISEQALSIAAGRAGCMTLLQTVPRPTAIIGTADVLAIGAMFEAQGRGLRVPDALSVAGIDNVDVGPHLSPSLTTVNMPAAEIGAEAAALMLRRLRDKTDPAAACVSLPVNLVVRHSTAQPPGVAAAAP